MKYFDKKTHWKYLKLMDFTYTFKLTLKTKTLENDDFYIKIINFDQYIKKNSPSGEPPTGSHLRRWACLWRPAARGLNGVENIGENILYEIHEFYRNLYMIQIYISLKWYHNVKTVPPLYPINMFWVLNLLL